MQGLNNLRLRHKLLALVLPLLLLPLLFIGAAVGYIAAGQSYSGITKAGRDDLAHMADFALDLLAAHEREAFAELKKRLKAKTVGRTGYIYALDRNGVAVIHPSREGENLIDSVDDEGRRFIREMLEKKEGWIRYPWRNVGEPAPRMKIVRYVHFKPLDWVVAVGSYEDEFLFDAETVKARIIATIAVMTLASGALATVLMFYASRVITTPLERMTAVMRRVRGGNVEERMAVEGGSELADLATAFNGMSDAMAQNRELASELARQARMASIGVLSSGVAHEINNPLGVILGYAAHLEKKLPPDDPNRGYIEEIHREATRSKKIVQDLLSYARAPRPEMRPTDLNDLLGRLVDFAGNNGDLAQVEIRTEFDPSLPAVSADPDQVRQVAINLMLNAGAAMGGAGKLTLSTALLPDGRVALSFTDTGYGVPEENLEKIFEPFYTTRKKGTGLGLAISRQLVEGHHGTIEIRSREGEGTTVTVVLPVSRGEAG